MGIFSNLIHRSTAHAEVFTFSFLIPPHFSFQLVELLTMMTLSVSFLASVDHAGFRLTGLNHLPFRLKFALFLLILLPLFDFLLVGDDLALKNFLEIFNEVVSLDVLKLPDRH